jgi:protein gp37
VAQSSNIEWTDATVNFWWGCTKVGPGCDHCYAETWSKRTGGNIWGVGVPRRKIKSAATLIHRLDNAYADWAADATCAVENAKVFGLPVPHVDTRRRVFIQSMSDLFDTEVPIEWFEEAWDKIEVCDRLSIQIVTKRISVVDKRLAAIGRASWPRHAGLMITVVNQAEADRDIPRLLALKAKFNIPWVGLSVEPMLGAIDLRNITLPTGARVDALQSRRDGAFVGSLPMLDWVICGGESGRQARPMHPDWARSLRDQCAAAGVPFLFKQWGEWADAEDWPSELQEHYELMNRADGNSVRVGKKRAGRLLDGVEHNGFPNTRRAA